MEPTNSVYVNREFNCSVDNLFKWIVEPDLLCQWFGPKNLKAMEAKADLTVGGKYKIQLLRRNGASFFIEREYMEIEAPTLLVFSYRYNGLNNPPPNSIVNITLEAVDANLSKLSLIQKFPSLPSDMEKRTEAWEFMFGVLRGLSGVINT